MACTIGLPIFLPIIIVSFVLLVLNGSLIFGLLGMSCSPVYREHILHLRTTRLVCRPPAGCVRERVCLSVSVCGFVDVCACQDIGCLRVCVCVLCAGSLN